MRRSLAIMMMASMLVLGAVAVSIAASGKMKAQPGVFDPDKTKIVDASWKAKTGLPDAGNSNHALVLVKNGATATNAAAGASITGAEGQTVVGGGSFGWDQKTGTHCGAGSPRFNLVASDGFHFMGGCANSTQSVTPGAPDWTRVRIDPSNPLQTFPVVTPGATIVAISILQDEGTDTPVAGAGTAIVDNILVNDNALIEKPGNN